MEWSPSQYEPQATKELAARLETAEVRTITAGIERRQKWASVRRNTAALSLMPAPVRWARKNRKARPGVA
jgi:hypothetical protein